MLFRAADLVPVVRSVTALNAGLRPNQKTEPCTSLVPDFVTSEIEPPALCPELASTEFLSMLASITASLFGTQATLYPTPTGLPSTIRLFFRLVPPPNSTLLAE